MNYNDNKNYQRFLKQKNNIKQKYSEDMWKYKGKTKHNTEEYKKYLKEVTDLMFKLNGDFQKYTWDIISQSDRKKMEARSKSNTYGRKSTFNYY